jgi:predicted metal-dependent peptidase
MKLTAEQRIERAHVQLMQNKDWCLFSGVFMIGKVEVRDDVPTAHTNGRDVTYGRKFVDSLDDKMLNFLVIHEAMHKAYRHLHVWRGIWKEDARLANAAMDYVINLQIRDTDPHESVVAMPRDADGELLGLIDTQYRGMDTMQVFRKLQEKQEKEKQNGHGQEQGDSGLDAHDWEGAAEMDEKEAKDLAKEIDHALREGSMLVGKLKGNVPRGIDELLHPKVDWREALREFVKSATRGGDQSTWRRPHRKYLAVDLVMPSSFNQKAETIAVAVDTSGSIGSVELTQFMSEVKSICDEVTPETVELLYWDSKVAGHETYHGGAVALLTESTKPKGGGGTAPDCVPKFLRDKLVTPQCVVVLTDGHFGPHDASKWADSAPVLWCVTDNKQFTPKVGQCIFLN